MGSYIQIIMILIVVGGPFIARVWQEIEKKRKARQRQRDFEAQQLEALRTGRVQAKTPGAAGSPAPTPTAAPTAASTVPPTVTERRQELARRRQQKLEELRRRGRSQQQQGAPSRPSVPGAGQPTPGPRRIASPAPPIPAPPARPTSQSTIGSRRLGSIAPQRTKQATGTPEVLGKRMTPQDWQRFIVGREILDPPLALRDPDRQFIQ